MSLPFTILVVCAFIMLLAAVTVYARRWKAYHYKELVEDILKFIFSRDQQPSPASIAELSGGLKRSQKSMLRIMQQIERSGLIQSQGGGFVLTRQGQELAVHIIRAHRLLERYLIDEARMSLKRVHTVAEKQEHRFTKEQLKALNEHLGHPTLDPHGDPIPAASGQFAQQDRYALTDWPAHQPARVVHVEDEPTQAMNQILKAGIEPGSIITIIEKNEINIQFKDGDRIDQLAPAIAANVHVQPAGPTVESNVALARLSDLPKDRPATVIKLADQCRGFTRRRLLDLGFTPGAKVTVELTGAGKSARAYRIRETLIALRMEQARQVLISIDLPTPTR